MTSITPDMKYLLSLITYANKYGITKAAIKYKTDRQYISLRKRRYDGTIESLRELSRRSHHHPNEHTPDEITIILNIRKRNPHLVLVAFWGGIIQRGYKSSLTGLYRFLRNKGILNYKTI